MIGASREMVSRVMKDLHDQGVHPMREAQEHRCSTDTSMG